MTEQDCRRALDLAAKQLSYRALSQKAMREKLIEKGCDEDAAAYAVAWLAERGLLDDAAYAASLVRSYGRRGYGGGRIRQELLHRGVGREDAETALAEFSPSEQTLLALLDRRLKGDISDKKTLDKAIAALRRRGFAWNEIQDALREYGASLEEGVDEE